MMFDAILSSFRPAATARLKNHHNIDLSDLNFGVLIDVLHEQLDWVLRSTQCNSAKLRADAELMAKGMQWLSNSFLAVCICDSHVSELPPVRISAGIGEYSLLSFYLSQVSLDEQNQFVADAEIENPWPEGLSKQCALDVLELAISRWYTTKAKDDEILTVTLGTVGVFYFLPQSRENEVLRALSEK